IRPSYVFGTSCEMINSVTARPKTASDRLSTRLTSPPRQRKPSSQPNFFSMAFFENIPQIYIFSEHGRPKETILRLSAYGTALPEHLKHSKLYEYSHTPLCHTRTSHAYRRSER